MKYKLDNCPFCGGKAVYESKLEVISILDEYGAYIDADTYYYENAGCPSCDIWFSISADGEEETTIKKWNRRTNDE